MQTITALNKCTWYRPLAALLYKYRHWPLKNPHRSTTSVKWAEWRIIEATTEEDPGAGNPPPNHWNKSLMEGNVVLRYMTCTEDQLSVTISTAFSQLSAQAISISQCSLLESKYTVKIESPEYVFYCSYLCQNIQLFRDCFNDGN